MAEWIQKEVTSYVDSGLVRYADLRAPTRSANDCAGLRR